MKPIINIKEKVYLISRVTISIVDAIIMQNLFHRTEETKN